MEPHTRTAPAKLNLYLHITGKRADGYHLLDSLVAFTGFGDTVTISPASHFACTISGPFAAGLDAADNLAVKAAQAFSAYTGRPLDLHITLVKNIPVAAGLGGGSADAAATLNALNEFWDTGISMPELAALALPLGADVPMCLTSSAAYVTGIGETIKPATLPSVPVLLINPNKPCATAHVFAAFTPPYKEELTRPHMLFEDGRALCGFLKEQQNQLTGAAIQIVPDIAIILDFLSAQPGCTLARMSGSGATCFGLFHDKDAAQNAQRVFMQQYPHYWSCVTDSKS